MTNYTDEQIRQLILAFQKIDFSQPNAHKVFRDLEKSLTKLVIDDADNREYFFFKLGRIANIKRWEFDHITPTSFVPKETGEKE